VDIVDFWEQQVAKWQEEEKCGFCWEFGAPLFENASNIAQTEEDCCTYVFLTNIKKKRNFKRYPIGTVYVDSCDYSFNVHIIRKGDLGTNNYNEIKGYAIADGRYNTIYKPIADCLDCDVELDFCEFIGLQVDGVNWQEEMEQAYLDNNYFGWKITATFRLPR
jgi:hypothetical protein